MPNKNIQNIPKMIEIAWLHASEVFGLYFLRYIINGKEDDVLNYNQAYVLQFMHQLAHKVERKEISETNALLALISSDNNNISLLDELINKTGQERAEIPRNLRKTELQFANLARRIASLILLKGTKVVDVSLFMDFEKARKTGYEYIDSLAFYLCSPVSNNPESDYSHDATLSKLYEKSNQQNTHNSFRSVFMKVIHRSGSSGINLRLETLNSLFIQEGTRKFAYRKNKSLDVFVICCLEALKDFKYIVQHGHFWRQLHVEFSGAELINSWHGKINGRNWKFVKNMQHANKFSIEIPERLEYKFNPNTDAQKINSKFSLELSNTELISVSALLIDKPNSLRFENNQSIFTPFTNSVSSSSALGIRQVRNTGNTKLSKEDLKQLLAFVRQIKKVEKKGNLSTALRRFSAASSRERRHDDALIDAVITLESLFSTGGRDQLRLRISSSVAFLLFPENAKKREETFKTTKEIYDTRSSLVHGGEVTPIKISNAKEDAILIIAECLKTLLLPDNKKIALNKDRANSLIIGIR